MQLSSEIKLRGATASDELYSYSVKHPNQSHTIALGMWIGHWDWLVGSADDYLGSYDRRQLRQKVRLWLVMV